MYTSESETIAAISTAVSNSGIGIIRMSGDEAFEIIKKIFVPAKGGEIDISESHKVHYGNIVDGNSIADEALVLIMKAPHTYTREDVVEIDCHGGAYVMKKVLDIVLKNGARAAEPGEFTKRAFMNGRIDLAQSEAVTDIINAENDYALKSAVTQLKGSVSEKIKAQRAILLEQIAYIEAALDDPEHIEMDGYGDELLPILENCRKEIKKLVDTADDGRIITEGIRTVILGKPNVGKSSLLNALLGQERAIVTDIAGTTRDALEEKLRIGDLVLNIVDTAGIRNTEDVIEKIGVEKAKEYAADADLILYVADTSRELDDEDLEIIDIIKDKKAIVILNKQDLEKKIDEEQLKKLLNCKIIETSVKEGTGLEQLNETIKDMFFGKAIDFNDQVYITNARQKAALIAAEKSLEKAVESIENGMPEDFFTIDMMAAFENLGLVIGEAIEDDLADEIFSKFCMGK